MDVVRTTVLIASALFTNICFAQGDYRFSVNGRYDFVRCNSVETVIARKAGGIVFSPLDYSGIGPVRFFAENDRYLFLKTVGRKRYSDRPENDFEGADSTKQFLFILDQSSEQVVGPLSVSEFEDRTSQQVSDLDWKRPRPIWPLFIRGLATIGLLVLICASAFVLRKMPTKVSAW